VAAAVQTLTHVIAANGRDHVSALTSLGEEVFVAKECSQEIEVYDADTFTLQHYIRFPGLGLQTHGIAACGRNRRLYLSDHGNDCIHRVELHGREQCSEEVVDGQPSRGFVSKQRSQFGRRLYGTRQAKGIHNGF